MFQSILVFMSCNIQHIYMHQKKYIGKGISNILFFVRIYGKVDIHPHKKTIDYHSQWVIFCSKSE